MSMIHESTVSCVPKRIRKFCPDIYPSYTANDELNVKKNFQVTSIQSKGWK